LSQRLKGAALEIARAALAAVDPAKCVLRALAGDDSFDRFRRIFVVGAGKATAAMARAIEERLGDRIERGWINVKYGHGAPLRRIVCHECGHPVPDEAGLAGSVRIEEIAAAAEADDLLVCLISGGASALMPYPVKPLTLADKRETTRLLLASGATIHEINTVRKHLSRIKGGRLARTSAPATVLTLILSDVVGDDLDVIGSGPTVPDPSTFAEARAILERRGLWLRGPEAVREVLMGARDESPKPGDPAFGKVRNIIVGSNRQALDGAQHKARNLGFHTILLSSTIEGEAREVARVHGAILREICASGEPLSRPACVLSGGETTVTIHGEGKGGRNQEFALAAALEVAGLDAVLILSFGTDGTDGPTDAAGAFATGTTLARATEMGLEAGSYLENQDSYSFFEQVGDLLILGPTGTNVMDLQILLAGNLE